MPSPTLDLKRYDLKQYLALRVVAVALVCFALVAALASINTYGEVRRINERVADLVVRQLQIQLFRIGSAIDVAARFPDWDPVTDVVLSPGQCVHYVKPDGTIGRSSCLGFNPSVAAAPAWFAVLSARLLAEQTDVVRPVAYQGKSFGTLRATTERDAVIAGIWQQLSALLGLAALLVATLCLLQYVAIGRALRPTRDILAGLDRLSRGDLSCRLPGFRLIELQRISEVFNALAGSLDRATREKTALAVRLVDRHEQERLHLARDLHDELAQTLSGISAVAASIRSTAQTECVALVPDVDRLAQASSAALRSLRDTLRALRPAEIDDLGLVASLSALAIEQQRRAGDRLRIALEIDEQVDRLPPTTAAHVYRIVQEGLTNIVRHANAGRARVVLGFTPQPRRWLSLAIEDDGCGMADHGAALATNGLGLIGMRERVTALGGDLQASPLAGRGFRLHASFPVDLRERALS